MKKWIVKSRSALSTDYLRFTIHSALFWLLTPDFWLLTMTSGSCD